MQLVVYSGMGGNATSISDGIFSITMNKWKEGLVQIENIYKRQSCNESEGNETREIKRGIRIKNIQFRCLSIAAYVHTSELFFMRFLRFSAS